MTVRLVAGDVDTAQVNCALRQLDRRIEEVARTTGTTAPPVNITDLAREVAAFINVAGPSSGSIGSLTFGIPPVRVGLSLSEGAALSPARADHVHTPLAFHGCFIDTTTTFTSVANDTLTAIPFQDAVETLYDPDGMHEGVTNPTRVTIIYPGYYVIGAACGWNLNATGIRIFGIWKNGTVIAESTTPSVGAVKVTSLTVATLTKAVAGDYLEVKAYQNSGGGLIISPNIWAILITPS